VDGFKQEENQMCRVSKKAFVLSWSVLLVVPGGVCLQERMVFPNRSEWNGLTDKIHDLLKRLQNPNQTENKTASECFQKFDKKGTDDWNEDNSGILKERSSMDKTDLDKYCDRLLALIEKENSNTLPVLIRLFTHVDWNTLKNILEDSEQLRDSLKKDKFIEKIKLYLSNVIKYKEDSKDADETCYRDYCTDIDTLLAVMRLLKNEDPFFSNIEARIQNWGY
jgi:hypothetical protein